jgi:hypothetical protein
MWNLLEKYQPLFNADGGGGGDGGAGGGAAGGDGSGAVGDGGAGAAAAAAGAPSGAAADQLYRPEGMADQFLGKSNNETIDNLHKAVDGYRKRDSERAVPENVEAYAQFDMDKLGADVPDAVKAHLPDLAKDPAYKAAAEAFKAAGVPVPAMQAGLLAAFKAMSDAGILEAPIDDAKERAALLPESAKALPKAQQDAAIDARLQANEDFITLMMKPGADGKARLDKAVGENALLMLMDTAVGNQFLEFVQGLATGAGIAQPNAGTGGAPAGSTEREQLRQALAAPEMNPQHPQFDRGKYDELDARYKRVIGN